MARNPTFHYNPDLFWDADPTHAKAKIKPGPNNPVGVVWIDISKPHYGMHGTPEPARVGHTTSHGCVRLTNWDAQRLAAVVGKGTKVEFTDEGAARGSSSAAVSCGAAAPFLPACSRCGCRA